MAGRWLFKEEPSHYSYGDLQRDKRTVWDGIGNNLALMHLRQVRKGDLFLYYHTGRVKAVVGIGRILSNPYPDPEAGDPRRVVVDVGPVRPLRNAVTLAAIKSDPAFKDFPLVRISRLSIMPVTEAQWKKIEELSQ